MDDADVWLLTEQLGVAETDYYTMVDVLTGTYTPAGGFSNSPVVTNLLKTAVLWTDEAGTPAVPPDFYYNGLQDHYPLYYNDSDDSWCFYLIANGGYGMADDRGEQTNLYKNGLLVPEGSYSASGTHSGTPEVALEPY